MSWLQKRPVCQKMFKGFKIKHDITISHALVLNGWLFILVIFGGLLGESEPGKAVAAILEAAPVKHFKLLPQLPTSPVDMNPLIRKRNEQ